MPLIGPDQRMVFVEGIPLLLIRPDDLLQQVHVQMITAGSIDAVDQFLYIRPAVFIKRNADGFWLVTENERDEFACVLCTGHFCYTNPSLRARFISSRRGE